MILREVKVTHIPGVILVAPSLTAGTKLREDVQQGYQLFYDNAKFNMIGRQTSNAISGKSCGFIITVYWSNTNWACWSCLWQFLFLTSFLIVKVVSGSTISSWEIINGMSGAVIHSEDWKLCEDMTDGSRRPRPPRRTWSASRSLSMEEHGGLQLVLGWDVGVYAFSNGCSWLFSKPRFYAPDNRSKP